jgi:hypothetical protein
MTREIYKSYLVTLHREGARPLTITRAGHEQSPTRDEAPPMRQPPRETRNS